MDEIYYNQCIACTVKQCKFHNNENYCTLGKIVIAKENKGTTCCASFKKK